MDINYCLTPHTTRKMIFEDERLSSLKVFILSLETLSDEYEFVTLSVSLKILVTNFFVTEWFYITKKQKQLVTHMFRHLMFYITIKTNLSLMFLSSYWVMNIISSSKTLFVDSIFRHQIFSFSFFTYII